MENSPSHIAWISESNFGPSPATPTKNGLKTKLQVKDEYSNGQFQQVCVRESSGLGRSGCSGMEARVDHARTHVQQRATRLILPCIALSAVNRAVGKGEAEPWVCFVSLWPQG